MEAGLGITFVSRWAVRNQLTLGTLRLAHVRGLKLSRMFSIAYSAGPEPTGNAGAFLHYAQAHSEEATPRVTGKTSSQRLSSDQTR